MFGKQKALMKTMTGEHYMLARVHFKIRDKTKVLRTFSRLKCIEFDPHQKRWTWLYGDEAKGLKFEVPYNKVPPESRPVVLASFFLPSDEAGYFNTNSFDRATKAITFFDQKIGRQAIEFTDIEVVNKLIGSDEMSPDLHQKFFDSGPPRSNKADVAWERMQMIAEAPISPERKRELLHQRTMNDAKKPLDLVERLPTNFYDPEGIKFLETSLRMRETIAIQHWLGKKDYSFHDLVQTMFKQFDPARR